MAFIYFNGDTIKTPYYGVRSCCKDRTLLIVYFGLVDMEATSPDLRSANIFVVSLT